MTGIGHKHYLDIASARDYDTFRDRLVAFVNEMDFPLVNATLLVERPGAKPCVASVANTPAAFAAQVVDPITARRDPVLQTLRTATAPFIYDQSMYVANHAGDLWEEQAVFGYGTGISMAMHLDGGRHFLLGVDREKPLPEDQQLLFRMMADLQLLAAYAQETAIRILMPQMQHDQQLPQLTKREQEILRWARDGKSSHVIGQLLSISLSTVNFHLRSAMDKLGVASKHQAAAKANALGLL
jgi:DNA-binding CsgD family transcriptional regulator